MIRIQNLYKAFGPHPLFSAASLEIFEKERIAILAPNGKGKSTLLRLILKEDSEYEGLIEIQSGIQIQSARQEMPETHEPLLDYALKNFPEKKALEEIRSLEAALHHDPKNQEILDKYSRVLSLFEKNGGYDFIYEAKKILEGMGFLEQDFNRPLSSFSGGESRRALLAALLVQKPEVLILDEPTNHLDIKNTVFLENFLKNYPGSVILVSHDREFLNHTITHVCEIEQGKLFKYRGNLTAFLQQKQERHERQLKELDQLKAEYDKHFDFISRFQAGTRASQASSREKRLLEVKEKMDAVSLHSFLEPEIRFPAVERLKPFEPPLKAEKISKKFDDKILFQDVSFTLKRGEKAALLGVNGSGKSTLFQILTGKETPSSGQVVWNQQVLCGYYTQEGLDSVKGFKNPYEAVLNTFGSRYQDPEIKNFLSSFRLPFETTLESLSGGEKCKLKLLLLLLSEANFLLLDEPTNHLDIYSIDGLKEILKAFQGNFLMVTHDRNLIRDLEPEILFLHEKKVQRVFFHHFNQVLEKLSVYDFAKKEKEKKDLKPELPAGKKLKNRQKEIAKLESAIQNAENEIREIQEEMGREEVYSNYPRLQELEIRQQALKQQAEEYFLRWEELQDESGNSDC